MKIILSIGYKDFLIPDGLEGLKEVLSLQEVMQKYHDGNILYSVKEADSVIQVSAIPDANLVEVLPDGD